MTSTDLRTSPRPRDVLREQVKATALSLRVYAIAVAALTTVVTMLVLTDFMRGRGGVEFAPELSMIPVFAGILLPIAMWQSERRFGSALFWTFPVDRTRHALTRVFAGWMLLMIAVTGFVLWLLILALITKGNIVGDEIVKLLPSSTIPPRGTLDPSMLRTVRWIPQRALWLVPFTAATAMYAMATAFMLGLRHPFRWVVGVAAALFLIMAVSQSIGGKDALEPTVGRFVDRVFSGRYGLDALMTARSESLHTAITLSNGEAVSVWRGLPVISDWMVATLLWTGLALAGLFVALMRHRERR
jgi:hypothetical protein